MEITIDGKACACEKGEILLDVARRNKIFIPTLCQHESLVDRGACRVCIVEVEIDGWKKIVTSCLYPVESECTVYTNSERILHDRAMILALLSARAPESELIANMAKANGNLSTDRFTKVDKSKCIVCGLCVRACDALGVGAISMVERGTTKKVSTPYDEPSKDCIGCASCAAVCPTGFIEYEQDNVEGTRTIWERKFNLASCERCGVFFDTEQQIAHSREVAGLDEEGSHALLCDGCRREAVAKGLAEARR